MEVEVVMDVECSEVPVDSQAQMGQRKTRIRLFICWSSMITSVNKSCAVSSHQSLTTTTTLISIN